MAGVLPYLALKFTRQGDSIQSPNSYPSLTNAYSSFLSFTVNKTEIHFIKNIWSEREGKGGLFIASPLAGGHAISTGGRKLFPGQ